MTLKEKFKKTLQKNFTINEIEEIADEFAIGFADWLILKCDYQRHGIFEYLGQEYTNKELLEIYKQQIK